MSSATDNSLDKLFADLVSLQTAARDGLPPVHLWQPQQTGNMDLQIDREGRWIYQGSEIKRPAMVKLFSSLLRREGRRYFLLTPVEKWQISVHIAPFFIVHAQRETRQSQQAILMKTRTEDVLLVGEKNPLWVDHSTETSEPIPLVTVRDNLNGLISRAVYYQLVDWGYVVPNARQGSDLMLDSMGQQFLLGSLDEG